MVSLHEVQHTGVMWSVIGEVFFSFFVILFYYYFHLFCIPKTNYWFTWGYWVLPPYPNSVKDMHPEYVGMSQDDGVGASWNLVENNKCLVFTLDCNTCNPSLKCSRIIGTRSRLALVCKGSMGVDGF